MNAINGISQTGDLKNNTWTFKMNEPMTLRAGEFTIIEKSCFERIFYFIEKVKKYDDMSEIEKFELSNEAEILINELF